VSSLDVASEFHNLVAYRLAVDLSESLHSQIRTWPSFELWTTGVQLMRAVDSIGANIAEAGGRLHDRDKGRFLVIARGSLYETEHFVARARYRGLLEADESDRLAEIARALNGLVKKWTSR
jgi:four helix bundle protein